MVMECRKEVFLVLSVSNFINSVFKIGKHYYPHVFLGECKHIVKEKKI